MGIFQTIKSKARESYQDRVNFMKEERQAFKESYRKRRLQLARSRGARAAGSIPVRRRPSYTPGFGRTRTSYPAFDSIQSSRKRKKSKRR